MSGLPGVWQIAELHELTTKIVDGSHNPPPGVDVGEPMLSARNIEGGRINFDTYRLITPDAFEREDARTAVATDDVLLTIVGTIGRSAVVPAAHKRFALQRSVAVLRSNGSLLPHYLRHYLEAYETQQWMLERAKGTAQKGIYLGVLAKLPCPVPPLAEQRRIVAKLDALTARTARARADLDRIPALAARYKQAVLAKVFPSEHPGGTRDVLSEIALFVTSGSRGWAKYYADTGAAFVRVGNVQRRDIRLNMDDVQLVRPPKGAEGERTRLQKGDILVTITADLGRVGVFSDAATEAYINQHVALVRLKNDQYAKYVAWFLCSEDGQQQLLEKDKGTTKAGLGLDDIRSVRLPLPDLLAQQRVVASIERSFAEIDRLVAEAAAARRLLDRLDQAILAKAFRGELVPQDPADEAASILLDRIRAERAAAPKTKRGRKPVAA